MKDFFGDFKTVLKATTMEKGNHIQVLGATALIWFGGTGNCDSGSGTGVIYSPGSHFGPVKGQIPTCEE